LATAKISILPSRSEGIPLALIEAMACGSAVIGTNITGIPELISDGHSGFLIEPHDPIALAEKIQVLLLDDSLRKKFINNALETVRMNFDLRKETEKLYEIWQQAIRGRLAYD
jgi:glycosyltransferase involved in cell wall biosynthesis